jgi:acyl carrier protein
MQETDPEDVSSSYAVKLPSEWNTTTRIMLEQSIIAIWRQLLGLELINISSDFFELGGDSLLATRLVSALCETFGTMALSVHNLPVKCTVASLVDFIEEVSLYNE